MYDIIGDIHGHAKELKALLAKLGYHPKNLIYRHPDRTAVFIGDLIDRGPEQREVVNIVRSMVCEGSALCIMGNHEYNAICYHTKDPDAPLEYLRKHTAEKTKQHQQFLQEYMKDPKELEETIQWFQALPLWLDMGDFRVIHACWDQRSIDLIGDPYLFKNKKSLVDSVREPSDLFQATDCILKGKEFELPNDMSFKDNDGKERCHTRLRWWLQGVTDLESLGMQIPKSRELIGCHVPDSELIKYETTEKPLFIGHYWMRGEPSPLADNIACLDYSIASPKRDGKLVAYRFNGEKALASENYVSVQAIPWT